MRWATLPFMTMTISTDSSRVVKPDPDGPGPLDSPITTYTYDAESQLTTVGGPSPAYHGLRVRPVGTNQP